MVATPRVKITPGSTPGSLTLATDTRERLIDAARTRFYRDGFRNVGLDAILDDVGISKTAFYKHFESKDDLMIAVLDGTDQWLRHQFMDMIRQRGGRSAEGQLLALFDVVEAIIEEDDFHGCIFINAAMEFPLPHDPAHEAAARNKVAIETIVHDIAERAGIASPIEFAREICLIIEGTYVTRTVSGDKAVIDTARHLAQRVLAAHLPPRD